MKKLLVILGLFLTACGQEGGNAWTPGDESHGTPVVVAEDDVVVRGRAEVAITMEPESDGRKFLYATGSTTVTYTNVASTNFSINVAALVPGSITGNTLSLGHVDLATLSDNNLKVCNPGGSTKCTQAIIRIFTTGSISGFVHNTDNYGAPIFAGTLNPSTAIGLNAAGSVQVQTVSISGTKHKLNLSDFPSPAYPVSVDMSNAGAGSYSANFTIEYTLSP